ncbi:HdeD family acid-resistance protein, partial [Lutimonas sp.]|uniref:HdeD family acid-resistance protein n=1 Tax=Lutimonas sp. TaxID=1872403 RepID=UPI003C78B910
MKYWYLPLISGLIFIGVGIYGFAQPADSYVALAFVFSLSFLIVGIMDIFFAISNRKELEGWGWDLALGILTLLIGIVLLRHPEISILTLPLFVGFTMLFRSAMAIGNSLELKKYYINEWGTLMAIG